MLFMLRVWTLGQPTRSGRFLARRTTKNLQHYVCLVARKCAIVVKVKDMSVGRQGQGLFYVLWSNLMVSGTTTPAALSVNMAPHTIPTRFAPL